MMIVLALLLLAVAVAAVILAVSEGSGQVVIDEFGLDTEIPVWGVFVAGAITALLVLAGIAAFLAGVRRARARRTEIRYLRQKVAQEEVDGTTTDRAAADADADTPGDGHRRSGGRWRRHHTSEDADASTEQHSADATRS